jgi:hypothetical protein
MKSLPLEMREEQDKQRKEKLEIINKFQEKLKFSIISLLFFVALTAYTFFVPNGIISVVLPILFGVASLVFIQQTIRSYNYLDFHKSSYSFMENVYDILEDNSEL